MRWESLAAKRHPERCASLLDVPRDERSLEWLQAALQTAVSVEFSTIPPYLCALWSIQDELHEAAKSIRNVVQEEMLHMSLACNMLTAVGGVPKIATEGAQPVYPEKLPAGIHSDLTVRLSGYNEAALDGFIEIESPNDSSGVTIGEFYAAIAAAFEDLRPTITLSRQVAGPLAHMTISSVEEALNAISLIRDQGEGSTSANVAHTDELAHYYRFLELKERRHLAHLGEGGEPVFTGPVWDPPPVWPAATVPDGGYSADEVSDEVAALLAQFDRQFSHVCDLLQLGWEQGDETPLIRAIEAMFALTPVARSLMQIEIPGTEDNPGTYCPCFRRV